MMGQGSVPIGINNDMSCCLSLAASHNYSGISFQASALLPDSAPPAPAADVDYPEVDDWIMYCN